MRQFIINELSQPEKKQIEEYLQEQTRHGSIAGMYWLAIPDELLAEEQCGNEHKQCGPFLFGIEVTDDAVSFEFLVRSESNLHCSCTSYANTAQRQFVLDFIDKMVAKTGIRA